jgi:hypothetical protein
VSPARHPYAAVQASRAICGGPASSSGSAANDDLVSASTQNQTLAELLCLFTVCFVLNRGGHGDRSPLDAVFGLRP